ncbi:MAG: hypothetical protein AAGF68_00190 [Pseudomonadota bacterium]
MQTFDVFTTGLKRRALLKLTLSAAAIFAVFGVVTRRTGEGTWVLRQDDI